MTEALADLARTTRRDPAFALYLAALAALGVRWLSPLESLSERAIWSDALIAASALAWALQQLHRRRTLRVRAFHLGLGLYLAAGLLSMAFAADFALAVENVLVMAELCVLALLTSQFASDARRLNAIVLVVCFVALYSAALAIAATALFYAGIETSLLGDYGALGASDRYARIAAGFESATLLGSFCIFASAIAARDDTTLPIGLRRTTQVALAVVVLMTLSRAVLGFAAAIAIRAAYRPSQPRVVRIAAVTGAAASVMLIVALTVGRPHVDLADPGASSYEFATEQVDRWNFAGDGIKAFADRPLVGHGPGALPASYLYEDYRVHMTPVNVAATMGILALAALVFLIVTLWRNRRRPTPIATWSGLAGLALDGLTLDIDHFRHVWILLGLADAERRPDPRDDRP